MNPPTLHKEESFDGLGIAPRLLQILDTLKFTKPTPIQHKAIPVAVEGKDLIGIAQTGTGKTLAFGVPMIQKLARESGRGLVLLPTRELAYQVDQTLMQLGRTIGLKTVLIVGGAPIYTQKRALRSNHHIIIATPGRLIDHMHQGGVNLSDIKVLVLDEADRMLDIGFAPQINEILSTIKKDRQTMLFSATMPREIVELATRHMRLPLRIEVAPSGTAAEKVEQELIVVSKGEKMRLLGKLLEDYKGPVLVFSRTKFGAKRIAHDIRQMGHKANEIHSNRTLAQRREALGGFQIGKYRVLVATDIAARGIDVKGIELVVNFDLPENSEDYVHRIGRTGRAGHSGKAISFATPDQRGDVLAIERLLRSTLPKPKIPGFSEVDFDRPQQVFSGGGRSFGGRRRGGFRPRYPASRPRGGFSHRGRR